MGIQKGMSRIDHQGVTVRVQIPIEIMLNNRTLLLKLEG
jgi:hypothetical protein